MGTTAQSSPKHERPAGAFFSCPCLRAGCSALRGYAGLAGYPYGGFGYPYAVAKPVVNEVEAPVPVVQYAAIDTGCKNSFGHAVPCLQEGEPAGRDPLTRKRLPLPPLPPSCPTDSALATTVLATPDLDTMDSATPMPWLPPPLSRLRSRLPSTSTCLR